MCRGQGRCDLARVAQCFVEAELAALQSRGEGFTLHEFHHDVAGVAVDASIVDADDVGMGEAAGRVRLVEEHLASDARLLLVFLVLDVVELDGDVATVIGVVRQEYAPSTALSDLMNDDVLADAFAYFTRDPLHGCD